MFQPKKILNLLDTSNLAQNVIKSNHLHGHILDRLLSPSDSSFVSNVTVGDLVSDHTLVKCDLDFACPAIQKVDSILAAYTIKSACRASDLYHQFITNLGCVLDRHALLICRRVKGHRKRKLKFTYILQYTEA